MAKTSREEQKWQAESDASTMAAYQEIMNDKPRMQRAIKVAQDKAKDLTRRANAMQTVARSGSNKGRSSVSKGRRK